MAGGGRRQTGLEKFKKNSPTLLKKRIIREARRLGANLVGFAPVSRWAAGPEPAVPYHPESIWPQARTVIVLGVPMLLPIIESTPSINYQEMYNAANRQPVSAM